MWHINIIYMKRSYFNRVRGSVHTTSWKSADEMCYDLSYSKRLNMISSNLCYE